MTESTDTRSELNTSPAEDAPPRRQYGQRVEVVVDTGGAEPDVFTVHVINPDRIRYEQTAARHPEWPPLQIGQSFAMAFVTWAAAKRTGQTALDFDQWSQRLLDWDQVDVVPADPTRRAASPGSTSI